MVAAAIPMLFELDEEVLQAARETIAQRAQGPDEELMMLEALGL